MKVLLIVGSSSQGGPGVVFSTTAETREELNECYQRGLGGLGFDLSRDIGRKVGECSLSKDNIEAMNRNGIAVPSTEGGKLSWINYVQIWHDIANRGGAELGITDSRFSDFSMHIGGSYIL